MILPMEPDPAPLTPEVTGEMTQPLFFCTLYLCGSNQPDLVQWTIRMFAYLASRGACYLSQGQGSAYYPVHPWGGGGGHSKGGAIPGTNVPGTLRRVLGGAAQGRV